MRILQQNSESIKVAAEILNAGGVIAFSTETVYGVGCRCDNMQSIANLRHIKGRDANKPFQTLIPEAAWARRYTAEITPETQQIMDIFFPGPLTLVLPAAQAGQTVGLRVPDSPWLLKLMRHIDCGLAASSANLSGEQPATNAADAAEIIGGRVDLLVDGGTCRTGKASTVAGFINGEIKIIRPGAITLEQLQQAASL